jgi:hypothetical protein
MRLNAPRTIVFIIAVVIAILAALAALGVLTVIPIPSVWLMAIAFVVLAGGCLLRGV